MATLTWTTGASGLWSTASNWSPAQAPAAGDSVFVTLPGSYLITLPASVQIGSLTLSDAQAVISTGGSLEIDGSLAISAGTLQVTGTLNASGFSDTGTLVNNGSVTLNGTMSAASLEHVLGGGLLTVNGTVLNTGGTLDGTPLAGQTLLNLGTIVGGTVSNVTGRFVSATFEGVTWQGALAPFGSLVAIDGLTLTGAGGTGSGTLTANVFPLQLNFVNTQTFDSASVIGFGTFTAGSTLTLGSNLTFDETLNLSSTIQSFVFNGNTILNHGTIFGHSHERSVPNLTNDGLISVTASDFENDGVINAIDITSPGTHGIGIGHYFPGQVTVSISGATFNNNAGGAIEIGQSVGIGLVTIAATTAFTNDGTLLTLAPTAVQGGTIDVGGFLGGSGTIEINGGGIVELEGAAASTQSLDFAGTGTLILNQPAFVPSSINGFSTGDDIHLGVAATPVSYNSGDLRLQIAGGSTLDLAVTGARSLSDFMVTTNAASTDIQLACFVEGTRLATTRGMVPVEALRVGEMMLLANDADSLPVVWIGYRTVDCRHYPNSGSVRPVRIAAGAFARGVPKRDLCLSPDHAVFANGVLIPVKYLVNGRTIAELDVERVSYWHVELTRHAVLLAEGLSVESLLPTSDHSGFANGGGVVALHPDWAWEGEGCARLAVTGPEVAATRAWLARRAGIVRRPSAKAKAVARRA